MSPWLTTVAASTSQVNESTVRLGNGKKYIGASITAGVGSTPTVLAADVAVGGADPEEAQLCYADTLDPTKAAGKIVVCDRGVIARIDKSFEVQRAGGVGMIMVNTSPNSLNADLHPIPAVHLDDVLRGRDQGLRLLRGEPDVGDPGRGEHRLEDQGS